MALRLELPRGGGGCVFGAPTAGHPPPADAMMWDLLHCVGVDGVLTLWHALLLERSVLLVSDTPALLGASCEALRAFQQNVRAAVVDGGARVEQLRHPSRVEHAGPRALGVDEVAGNALAPIRGIRYNRIGPL